MRKTLLLTSAVFCFGLMGNIQSGAATIPPLGAVIESYENLPRGTAEGANGREFALPAVTPVDLQRRRDALKTIKSRLDVLDRRGWSDEDRLNADLLAYALDEQIGVLEFDEARLPFNSDGGFDVDLVYLASGVTLHSADDINRWIDLLGKIPAYYDDNIGNARRGIQTGFTEADPTVAVVLARAESAASSPVTDTDFLIAPVVRATASLNAAEKAEYVAKAKQIVEAKVRPAQFEFVRFLKEEYRPHARRSLAVTTLPNGKAYYEWLVKRYTTTDMSPDAIFDLGQNEVTRIRGEMDAVMRETGFTGTPAAFLAYLRADPQFYATSREQLLEKASEVAKRIDDQLPAHFATLPRLTYGVRPVPTSIEEGYTTGRYFQGDPARGIAGGLMINTSHLDQRPLYELPALELHEGVPGHHLQIALGQENLALPDFRRNGYYSAFGEGWGLYSEWLGEEMGIYRTPYERFGRLSYEMWRACRLVADTGIHTKGWTVDQAKACFLENTALSPHNIDTEVQRYISWPGQALSYKIGEIQIKRLRARAETELGKCFDERRFHDAILLNGAVPLEILSKEVDAWISREKATQDPSKRRDEPLTSTCKA
ncbi:DUF885 domain-containing protein [Asticcacaulis sp.]|uniref:DUF885 domain-containing protein n=1 Tax=Asticcacaulis sp. TaxID=1872648 RepID=UPI003F7CA5E9